MCVYIDIAYAITLTLKSITNKDTASYRSESHATYTWKYQLLYYKYYSFSGCAVCVCMHGIVYSEKITSNL